MTKYDGNGVDVVYIDESGFANHMPRTHGYSKKGMRCYGVHDWHSKGRVNVIGAICNFTFVTVCMFEASINADIFCSWIKQDLLPKIKRGSVVVMDNAPFHKRSDIRQAIQDSGMILEYMPTYSPDLNPIEKKWSQKKAIRRREQCSVAELFEEPG